MKTLIVYNHPYSDSFNHALLEAVIAGAKKAGHEVDVIDLDQDHFDPVMTGKDLLAFRDHQVLDPQAKDYVARLQVADHLVMLFPIWRELMPALTKGFIDKVIFPGAAYEYTASGYGMRTLLPKLRSTTVITTMNTPKLVYRFIFGNAIKQALLKGTFKKTGMKNIKWFNLTMVKNSTQAKRKKWLTQVEEHFAKK